MTRAAATRFAQQHAQAGERWHASRALRLLSLCAVLHACAVAPVADVPDLDLGLRQLVAQGREALSAERPAKALAYFQRALELAPVGDDHYAVLMGLGRSAMWLERYTLAERVYRDAAQLATSKEDQTEAAAGLARALNALNRPYSALEVAESAAGSPKLDLEAGRAARSIGSEWRATQYLGDVERHPDTPNLPSYLARDVGRLRDEVHNRTQLSVRPELAYEKDSDGLSIASAGASVSGSAQDAKYLWHGRYTRQHLDDDNSSQRVNELSGGIETMPTDHLRLSARAGAGRSSNDWKYGFGGADVNYRPNDDWGVNAAVSSEPVKTVLALERRIQVRSLTVGGEVNVAQTTIAGSVFTQRFSDDNARDGLSATVSLPSHALGNSGVSFTPQIYARYFKGDKPGQGYFNPERFHEQELRLIFSQRLSNDWRWRLTLAPGRQSIDGDSSGTLSGQISAQGPIGNGGRIEFHLGHGDSAGFASSGEGYRRSYGGVTVTIPW